MKKVVFRVDSSTEIGTGHVMRCLTLAEGLREKGVSVYFICRNLKGNMGKLISDRNFGVLYLPEQGEFGTNHFQKQDAEKSIFYLKGIKDVDLMVVDHYALDSRWEDRIRPFVNKIMVIDDLADRKHQCDILLDQNLYEDAHNRYQNLVPNKCRLLLGPQYTLLRSEFCVAREQIRKRDGVVRSIMITFGGSDPTNETKKVLDSMRDLVGIKIHVVVGTSNIFKDEIKKICNISSNMEYHCQINNIAELMLTSDLSIGASGSTSWERCCLGLPSVIVATAPNQVELAENLSKNHIAIYLGLAESLSVFDWREKILSLLDQKQLLLEISENGLNTVDGRGTYRVINELTK